jgi:hypothetical protein
MSCEGARVGCNCDSFLRSTAGRWVRNNSQLGISSMDVEDHGQTIIWRQALVRTCRHW